MSRRREHYADSEWHSGWIDKETPAPRWAKSSRVRKLKFVSFVVLLLASLVSTILILKVVL